MDLTPYYGWLVLLHIVGAFVFVMGHGVSMWVSFQVRSERDPTRIRTLLELSSRSLGMVYGGLLLLLLGGIVAGIVGNWFGRGWIWASLATLVLITVLMYAIATRYYAAVRQAVGLPTYNAPKNAPPPAPASAEELDRLLDSRRPDLIALVGGIGLLVILWLMVMKPF